MKSFLQPRMSTPSANMLSFCGTRRHPLIHTAPSLVTCSRSVSAISTTCAALSEGLYQHFVLGWYPFPHAGELLLSPYGSIAWLALGYNLSVTGPHHIQYTVDMFIRDYIQDPVLCIVLRYLLILSMIALILQIVIEV